MTTPAPRAWALLLLLLVLALPTPALAQEAELLQWVEPTLGRVLPRASVRYTLGSDERVAGQRVDFGFEQQALTLTGPLAQRATDELTAFTRARHQDVDTRARFPDTGGRFPDELWDVRFGLAYRHRFENAWIAGLSLTLGSASDEPFASADELTVRVAALLRVPSRERHAWLVSLFYANDQEVLGGVPVPGLAYYYHPSDRFTAVVGVPFTSVEYRPVPEATLEASYFPLRRVRARATYRVFRPVRIFVGFDWDNESYFLADRRDEDDRLFYYEKRVLAGGRFDLRYVGFEVTGGYVFDRFYFVGERYSDRRDDRLDIDAGPFVAVRIDIRFGDPAPGQR
jgi:hypothetical protein